MEKLFSLFVLFLRVFFFFLHLASYTKRIPTRTGLQYIAAESDLSRLYNRICLDINVQKKKKKGVPRRALLLCETEANPKLYSVYNSE